MQKASVAYMQTQITTTNQGELLLMLYAGAIKFLSQAKEEIEKKNYAEKGMLISKAMDIIAELDGSLNMEKGGDLSKNLHQLYMFCNSHLLKASIKMNAKSVDEVINILDGLRSAYAQVINMPDAVSALNEAPAQNLTDAMPRTGGNRIFADTEPLRSPVGPAAAGISAKAGSAAYIQQAQTIQPAETALKATGAGLREPVPEPDRPPSQLEAQAVTHTAAHALNALATQAEQPVQGQTVSQRPDADQVPPPAAPTGFGFARQMNGSAMYRKMSGQA